MGWMRLVFLQNIYNQPWYNGRNEKDGVYVENKMSVLIGMPWMRQLRIKKSKCKRIQAIYLLLLFIIVYVRTNEF